MLNIANIGPIQLVLGGALLESAASGINNIKNIAQAFFSRQPIPRDEVKALAWNITCAGFYTCSFYRGVVWRSVVSVFYAGPVISRIHNQLLPNQPFMNVGTSFQDEYKYVTGKVLIENLSSRSFLHKRIICIWLAFEHSLNIILRPIISIPLYSGSVLVKRFFDKKDHFEVAPNAHQFYLNSVKTGLVVSCLSPISEAIMAIRALGGLFVTESYLTEDYLSANFKKLAAIAERVGCSTRLVDHLKKGSQIILCKGGAPYYTPIIEEYTNLMCHAFEGDKLSPPAIKSLLDHLEPVPEDMFNAGGIKSCLPGLVRILDQIRCSINIPADPSDVIPWLKVQYKLELLQTMVSRCASRGNWQHEEWEKILWHAAMMISLDQSLHRLNALTIAIGEETGLPQEVINTSKKDTDAINNLTANQKQILFEAFNRLYNEDELIEFMLMRINSQDDGSPGLKKFGEYILRQLAEQVTDEELKSHKTEVQSALEIGESFADDPIFYVRWRYCLHPTAPAYDLRHNDLNKEAMQRFMEMP